MTEPQPVLDYARPQTQNEGHFKRSLGLWPSIAINMTQMCGIGPFLTIPLMVAALGGPQAIFGWLIGAILVMADGLVWAELGAAIPGAGGTYLYLREAFQSSTGKLMPFLFIWTAMIFIPLTMSGGIVGTVPYFGYIIGHEISWGMTRVISIGTVVVMVIALYRDLAVIAKLTYVLFAIMLLTVALLIVASLTHFHANLAFDFTPGAFRLHGKFWMGLGAGLIFAIFDYLGYNTTAYMAEEIRDPGRVLPRSIIYSIIAIMFIYLCLNISIMGVMPWQDIVNSDSIGSKIMAFAWGRKASIVFTWLIIITALASQITGLLGGSRVPYHAAKDKVFFSVFGKLHPRYNFPHISLLVIGGVTIVGVFFKFEDLVNIMTAVLILIQSIAQIAALILLRIQKPQMPRPYRMFLYPIPCIIALAGWVFVYMSSGKKPILLSLAWVALGIIAFLIWAAYERTWPFGPTQLSESRGFEVIPIEDKVDTGR